MPPGVSVSRAILEAAVAYTAARAASLSDAAVAHVEGRIAHFVKRRIWLLADGHLETSPHLVAKMLRDGCRERSTITDLVMAELPQEPDTWPFLRAGLDAAATTAPAAPRFVQSMFVSRAAVHLAFGRVRSEAVSAARIDAAGRSIAALQDVAKMTSASSRGNGSCSSVGGGGAAIPYDKAAYAAVRCVGRWGELCAEATAADTELASAQLRLAEARSSAASAAAALSSLHPPPASLI